MIDIKVKKITAFALTLLMSAAVLTACGDTKTEPQSADQKTEVSQALTKDEYVSRVKNLSTEIADISNQFASDMQSEDVNTAADATTELVDKIRPMYEELAALNAPEEFTSQQEKIKSGCSASLEILDLSVELIELGRGEIEGKEEEIANKVTEINNKMTELTSQASDMTAAINEVVSA